MKKLICFLCLVAILTGLFIQPIYADSGRNEVVNYDYSDLIESMPEEVKELLPEGIDGADDEGAIAEKFNAEYLSDLCSKLLQKGLIAGLKLFAALLGIIIISALITRCQDLFLGQKSRLFDYAVLLFAALELYSPIYSLFELIRTYIGQINDYMTAISAAMGSIFLLSGNVSTAAAQSVWLGILLTLTEKISYGLLFPLLQMSFAISLVSSVCPDIHIRSVTAFIRQICTTLMIASMTLITVFMSFQTSIASASDSLGLRSVKFAASNAIPIIGGLVSESMKTLATSLTLIKSTAGLIGVVGILLCTLLPLFVLFTCKYALSLSSAVADLLEAGTIKSLIDESGKLVGFLIAIVLVFSIFYIFTLSLLIHTANALA